MGKVKQKKKFSGAAVRNNPTDLTPIEEQDCPNDDVWQRISSQLQSSSSEERECGCASLSLIARQSSNAQVILDKKIIRIVSPLMLDSNLSVQHAAMGALRNVSLVDPEINEKMVEQDVMTVLCKLLHKYQQMEWKPVQKTTQDKIDSKTEIFIEAVHLLWNLCEASDVALKILIQNNILDVLIKHTSLEIFGHRVVTAVLQCLFTVSESHDCSDCLRSYESILHPIPASGSDGKAEDLHVQLLSLGIVLNLGQDDTILSRILQTISAVLQQDQRKLVHEFSSVLPMMDDQDAEEHKKVACKMSEEVRHVILAQQSALEILTNLASSNDDEEWNEIQEEENSDFEDSDNAGEEIMETDNMSNIVLEAIKAEKLVDKVLAKAILPAENVQDILKNTEQGRDNDGLNVIQMLSTLQCKAFLCLNNLVESLSVEDLGGQGVLFDVWKNLAQLCLANPGDSVIESATSAMRACTPKMGQQIPLDQLQQLAELGAASDNFTVRVNIVHMLGSLGQAGISAEMNDNQVLIAKFLLEAAAKDVELRVVIEALDQIIDIFSEDFTDTLANQVHLVGRLKQLHPGFKTKMAMFKQKHGKSQPEVMALASMVKTNLNRFIKYKEKRGLDRNGV